jgi:hypothetical protein
MPSLLRDSRKALLSRDHVLPIYTRAMADWENERWLKARRAEKQRLIRWDAK